jgi:23S rRNA (cytidine1920-2'-O)/16S rRNA (cytidine1409-2'-O)-methyltransferase
VLERTNVRDLTPGMLPFRPDLVVADLSFISIRLALPALVAAAGPRAEFVLLVKPQFEAGPRAVGKGGVVRDPAAWRGAVTEVLEACRELGAAPQAVLPSPLLGPAGNVEFFVHVASGRPERRLGLEDALREGQALRGAS